MAKPRVTVTDRLSNIIEVVELGRRTGLLAVERGAGNVLEVGTIFFINGRAVYAKVGQLHGGDALTVLARWGNCRFGFDPNAPRPTPNVSGVLPGPDTTGNLPAAPHRDYPDSRNSQYGDRNGSLPQDHNGRWPSAVPSDPRSSAPSDPYAMSSQGRSVPVPNGMANGMANGAANGMASQPGSLLRRPRRAPDVHDLMTIVNTYKLSRGHRAILLLADGEHSILDLSRLSSRSVDEVSQLLTELEAHGLIYYYS